MSLTPLRRAFVASLSLASLVGAQGAPPVTAPAQPPRSAAPRAAVSPADIAVQDRLRAERAEDPNPAPARREGEGPFQRLIIRGVNLIDGYGSAPRGPVDVVVEGNRITQIANVGYPRVAIDESKRPRGATQELDATGMYLMPGLVDLHVHQGTQQKAPDSEYYNKLWLANGITTVRGVPFASFDYSTRERARSAANEITAPRYVVYQRPGTGWGRGCRAPRRTRARGCAGPSRTGPMGSSSAPSARTSWRRTSTRRRSSASARRRTFSRVAWPR